MIRISKIVQLDFKLLSELRESSVAEGFKFVDRLMCEWESGANRFERPGEALFFCQVDGVVAGICGLNCDPYSADERIGRVRRLYVLPKCRKRGLGKALLQAVIAEARGRFELLHLRTEAAGAFFESNGFQPTQLAKDATHVLDLRALDSRLQRCVIKGG